MVDNVCSTLKSYRVMENPFVLIKYLSVEVLMSDFKRLELLFFKYLLKIFSSTSNTYKYLLVTGNPQIIVHQFHSWFNLHFIQSIILVVRLIINTIDRTLAYIYTARNMDVAFEALLLSISH